MDLFELERSFGCGFGRDDVGLASFFEESDFNLSLMFSCLDLVGGFAVLLLGVHSGFGLIPYLLHTLV